MDEDFVAYVEARTPALLRLAYLLTGDGHLAEDLVQEALTKAYQRWDRVQAADNPHAYVRRIVVTQHIGWRRRRAAGELPLAPGSVPETSTGDASGGVVERDAAWRALAGLPARQRAVLVLRYYEDLPDAEIAVVLGVAVGTVRSLASRAFAQLRGLPALSSYAPPPLVAVTAPATTEEHR
ncbi:SigE family RNA polymerase sigma factor [Nocardioides sp. TF02-7]|uniref:SigE family RNA polymerase sigma factor n=1 Tax=Nocardioides sp. TF02-7 TaxID=2917724 RepID=UPI001F0687BA|nr:SigE family RNA polymerase sigma factor [Nocardioides sp. TF02-7]UMG91007.1 SigE family RNA polymerase sigma factor [Nocardioides sp. TF02-7]